MRMIRIATLVALALVGCFASPTAPDLQGVWGGSDASLVLSADGGRLSYPCGEGTIATGWRVHSDGTFEGRGDHVFGGGPVPDTGRTRHSAVYSGMVRAGGHFTLSVVVEGNVALGPFDLIRGGPEVIERCR
jgi:hypothetical protein